MTSAELKLWFEIAEIGVKCAAVIAAGVWAVLLHRLLRRRETAQAGLRHTEAQIRDLELNYREQAVVRVEIRPTVQHDIAGTGYLILTTVDMINSGNRNTRVQWGNEPPAFSVHKVTTFAADGTPQFAQHAMFRVRATFDPDHAAPSHIIRAGGTESLSFATPVATPGVYLLSFRGLVDKKERGTFEHTQTPLPSAWTGSQFVVVNESAVCGRPELPSNTALQGTRDKAARP